MPGFWDRFSARSKREEPSVVVSHPTADVLVVCTANICRSPMGEAFLRASLAERSSSLTVTSAGFLEDGRRVDPLSAQAATSFGMDISAHRSARMSMEQLEAATVILCMTTEHRRKVVGFRTAFYAKTFTFQEFVRRSMELDPALRIHGLAHWLPLLHGDRTGRELLSDDAGISVADPYGQGASAHAVTATLLHDLCREVAELITSS
jgi:protein-tyrosine phosphatase